VGRVDYFAIQEEMAEIFRAHTDLANIKILVEEEILFGADEGPWLAIYLDRRDAVDGEQYIAAGTSTVFKLSFTIVCAAFSLDSLKSSVKARNDLVGNVELVLMQNRTLNEKVNMLWLKGGDMPSGRLPDDIGFVSLAEVQVEAEVEETV